MPGTTISGDGAPLDVAPVHLTAPALPAAAVDLIPPVEPDAPASIGDPDTEGTGEAAEVPRTEPSDRDPRARRAIVAVVVVAICAALPWVLPALPTLFGSAVPETQVSAGPTDPPVQTPTSAPTDLISPAPGLASSRLASAGRPLEVRVPRLGVDSQVVPISGQSGVLVPPNNPQVLGWWQEGRGTGAALGSAVVTGHTVHTGGGAFDHLGELVRGDRISVRTARGWITYIVQSNDNLSVGRFAARAAETFRLDGPGHLVLITCSNFDGTEYLSNSVVFATPVKDEPFIATTTSSSP